jgi:hypothetical protein
VVALIRMGVSLVMKLRIDLHILIGSQPNEKRCRNRSLPDFILVSFGGPKKRKEQADNLLVSFRRSLMS